MLSLDNAFTAEDVRDFEARVRRFLGLLDDEELRSSPSQDRRPLLSLRYEKGELVLGATRGDGAEGGKRHRQCAHDQGHPQTHARPPRAGHLRGPGRGLYAPRGFRRDEQRQEKAGEKIFAIRRKPPPARCASSMHRSPRGGPCASSPIIGRGLELPGKTHWEESARAEGMGLSVQSARARCRNVDEALNSTTAQHQRDRARL